MSSACTRAVRTLAARRSAWRLAMLGLLLAWLGLAPRPAQALCLTPLCTCGVSTTSIAFGAYNPLQFGPVDSTGSVRMSCGGVAGLLIPYTIELGGGSSGNPAARRMSSGSQTLNYALYSDSNRLTLWGNGAGGAPALNSAVLLDVLGLSPTQVHTIHGRIAARQTSVVPGSYADVITVTVTYY